MDKPLTVMSDRTMLLDVHSESASACRSDIIAFSELIKSPEHVHTYMVTALSVWNAVSAGIKPEEMIRRLEKWSRYGLDERVTFFITEMGSRYGESVLEEVDANTLRLSVKSKKTALLLEKDQSIQGILAPESSMSFLLPRKERGTLKARMIKLGYPVDDRIPLSKGERLEIRLKDSLKPRGYQTEAVDSILGDGGGGTGFGTIVLPCGSGKTIVGMLLMARLSTRTLILCPNVTAVHQWIRELLDKTELQRETIGEYSGEKKELRPVTVSTYQMVTFGAGGKEELTDRFNLVADGGWGLVIYDEVHMLPAPVFKLTAELQAIYRAGLTATLVREDHREDEVFSLVGPKRYDVPWSTLAEQGYIAKAWCHEIRIPLSEEDEIKYALGSRTERFRVAAENPAKIKVARRIVQKHANEPILIIGQYLTQLESFRKEFNVPIITGTTSNKKRDELYARFRSGDIRVLIVSKVANAAIDLPDASVAIQVSGSFGSRQEEAQRLGRILRPKERDSHFYTLISEYTVEEDYAAHRQQFLSEQGYSYSLEKED